MADSPVFEWVAGALEGRTGLTRLEARGTVRLALKDAGLEPRSLTAEECAVVLRRVLPSELERRRVADATALCITLARELGDLRLQASSESAYAVMRRLSG
jgi:hypothetical protein